MILLYMPMCLCIGGCINVIYDFMCIYVYMYLFMYMYINKYIYIYIYIL